VNRHQVSTLQNDISLENNTPDPGFQEISQIANFVTPDPQSSILEDYSISVTPNRDESDDQSSTHASVSQQNNRFPNNQQYGESNLFTFEDHASTPVSNIEASTGKDSLDLWPPHQSSDQLEATQGLGHSVTNQLIVGLKSQPLLAASAEGQFGTRSPSSLPSEQSTSTLDYLSGGQSSGGYSSDDHTIGSISSDGSATIGLKTSTFNYDDIRSTTPTGHLFYDRPTLKPGLSFGSSASGGRIPALLPLGSQSSAVLTADDPAAGNQPNDFSDLSYGDLTTYDSSSGEHFTDDSPSDGLSTDDSASHDSSLTSNPLSNDVSFKGPSNQDNDPLFYKDVQNWAVSSVAGQEMAAALQDYSGLNAISNRPGQSTTGYFKGASFQPSKALNK
jgi:hypothetical protein